ncbi:hypothetical protein KOAAANKH_02094 [Brevundimonas sp. NIBR10]|nr:hypothetical protein KOAAANKH_02094 [Brevundimonas sp. NIBR10]
MSASDPIIPLKQYGYHRFSAKPSWRLPKNHDCPPQSRAARSLQEQRDQILSA